MRSSMKKKQTKNYNPTLSFQSILSGSRLDLHDKNNPMLLTGDCSWYLAPTAFHS